MEAQVNRYFVTKNGVPQTILVVGINEDQELAKQPYINDGCECLLIINE